jgi:simple sugar transport system permease protein
LILVSLSMWAATTLERWLRVDERAGSDVLGNERGMLTEAVGINPEASRLAGVRARGIIFTAYMLSGLLAGIAGILYSSNIRAADANAAGLFIELYAILAVVLGGTSLQGGKFSIAGTVIGVLIIQTLDSTILFLGVPSAQSPVFFALVVVLVVVVQSPRLRLHRRKQTTETGSRESAETAAKVEAGA